MKSNDILIALGDVNERFVEEAAPKKKRNTLKWGALAACVLLICGFAVHQLYTPSFETFLKLYEKGYYQESGYDVLALNMKIFPIDNHLATYEEKPYIKQDVLEHYIGNVYEEDEAEIRYYIKGKHTLEYLISEDKADGKLTLWKFSSFSRGFRRSDETLEDWFVEQFGHLKLDLELDTCTFDEIFRIYGLESVDEIEKITVTPSGARDSDTKKLIWYDFKEKTLTDATAIQTVYDILVKSLAYKRYNEQEPIRFTYSFTERNGGDPYPCGQCELAIVLRDGTVIDLVAYNANIGAFQHGSSYSVLLSEEDVFTLNQFFGIQ